MLESSAARPCRAHLSLGWDEGDLRIAMGVVCLTHLIGAFSETHGLVRPGSLVTQVMSWSKVIKILNSLSSLERESSSGSLVTSPARSCDNFISSDFVLANGLEMCRTAE